ncbi:MAG: hypothetical protein WAL94_01030 [Bacteroidales bacterium]
MIRRLMMLLLCLVPLVRAGAQYYETGQDPASLRWQQIQTPHFRVIFPDNFGAEAQKYARLLEESYNELSVLYPLAKTHMPVIIHNYSMQSNGYVSWAPHRMELFPLPGQDNLPMDPAKQLAVHETTHVLQLSSLNRKGFGKALGYILGEQAVGLSALEIPQWAFEGDAVYAETVTGLSGRGRSNAFTQGARALVASPGGIYGYDKMIDGSYKDFTPNHYVFGYLMMNNLRSMGGETWSNAIKKVSSGYPFNPVNYSLRKETGLTKKKLYDSTFYYLAEMWNDSAAMTAISYPAINLREKKNHVSHYMPQRIDSNRIVSLKTSLERPSRFVITDESDGTEHVLTTTGYIYPYIFSYSDSTLVWSETFPDPRWDNRDYSVIKKMSAGGGPVTQLTFRTRYTAPDLSPDGRTIVAVSTTPEFLYSLIFLDAVSGETLMDVSIPGNLIIQRPAWSSDGKSVTVVTLSAEGEGIRTYHPTGKKWVVNRPETVTDIIQAEIVNDTLYFLAQGDGSDNIYRMSNDTALSRVTGARFGISGFSVTGGELLFSDYSTDGFNIASTSRMASAGPVTGSMKNVIPAVAPLPSRAGDELLPEPESYEAKPYSKAGHLLNFHSWFPFYGDIDEIQTDPSTIKPGVTIMSQNHLSTLVSSIGYEYSDGSHYFHSGIKWKGWYPVIEADITYGGKQIVTKDSSAIPDPSDISGDMILNTSIYDQFWFAHGKFRQLFMPALYLNYSNRYTYLSDENEYDKGVVLLTGRLYLSNTFRTAYRDINPRWGQVIDLRFTAAPWDNDLYGSRRYARGILFFPGFFTSHSLVLSAGYENQKPVREMLYRNNIAYPRGYGDNLISEKLFSFSADYTMPLFYPDLTAGSLLYLKRVRGSLFFDGSTGWETYDYAANKLTRGSTDFGSFGAELLADFYLLRLPFEMSAGASGGYIPAENRLFINAVFSVNVYGTTLGRKR